MKDIVDFLCSRPELSSIPRTQFEWLVGESTLKTINKGVLVARPGDLFEEMIVLLEGELQGYSIQQNQKKIQANNEPVAFTGTLPFSRMKAAPIFVEVISDATYLGLHKSKFKELAERNYEMTEMIVHSMVDRARHFTGIHFQNEKLMSLGKLSAGLAHELNNPASAILRGAESLQKQSSELALALTSFNGPRLNETEMEGLRKILGRPRPSPGFRLPLLERKRREDEIIEWLEDHNIKDESADVLVEAGFESKDLEEIRHTVTRASLEPVVTWLMSELTEAKTVHEIATAARRISELVQSVKSYTRMDQVQDMQEVCINDGIRNTIVMLQHKMRKSNVELHDELAEKLPLIMGFPGELNQVWTNLIDNALDAMNAGGELTVRSSNTPTHVVFSIIDNGPGIPQENLERIFDPFFTTKGVGEGTGVGLDIVQKVVRIHKGTVDVNSKPGRTEFIISFPRA